MNLWNVLRIDKVMNALTFHRVFKCFVMNCYNMMAINDDEDLL